MPPLDGSISHHESPSVTRAIISHEPQFQKLPNHTKKGVPKISYQRVLNYTPKFPLNNYVSYHRLSKTYESFASQLSIVHVSNSMQRP